MMRSAVAILQRKVMIYSSIIKFRKFQMSFKRLISFLIIQILSINCYAENEWTFIGKSANGNSVFTTSADSMTDGSLRIFLKGEEQREKEPTGIFAFLKKPEKYIETIGPYPFLIHCKKKSIRKYVAGTFGAEFYNPWEPITPGSYGALGFSAFCKKNK